MLLMRLEARKWSQRGTTCGLSKRGVVGVVVDRVGGQQSWMVGLRARFLLAETKFSFVRFKTRTKTPKFRLCTAHTYTMCIDTGG